MTTLKDVILSLDKDDHFRVYYPNRDCLLFESYFYPHFNDLREYEDPSRYYCERTWRKDFNELDDETRELIEKYGDHECFSIECSSCAVRDIIYENDEYKCRNAKDSQQPNLDWVSCLNIFIKC